MIGVNGWQQWGSGSQHRRGAARHGVATLQVERGSEHLPTAWSISRRWACGAQASRKAGRQAGGVSHHRSARARAAVSREPGQSAHSAHSTLGTGTNSDSDTDRNRNAHTSPSLPLYIDWREEPTAARAAQPGYRPTCHADICTSTPRRGC